MYLRTDFVCYLTAVRDSVGQGVLVTRFGLFQPCENLFMR